MADPTPWLTYDEATAAFTAGDYDTWNKFIAQSWEQYAGYQPELQTYETTTPLQQEVMSRMTEGQGPMGAETMGMTGQALQQALSGQVPWQSTPELSSAAFQAQVAQPMLEQYQRDILPSIQEAYVGPGTYWGSERAGAERLAGQNLSEELSRQLTGWQWNEQQAYRQARENAANRALQAGSYTSGLAQQMTATPYQASYFQGQNLDPNTLRYFYGLGSGAGTPWAQIGGLTNITNPTPVTGVQRSQVQYL